MDGHREIHDPAMRKRVRGQALAEFALVLPVFLLMAMAIIDVGRGIYIYGVMSNAAREGARYAIVHGELAQTLDGLCGSGPGTPATTKDMKGALVIEATGATVPAWAPMPVGCETPISVPPVGLNPTQFSSTVCWGDDCTIPADCSAEGSSTAPRNSVDVPVSVRTCYRFAAIIPSFFGQTISLTADTTLTITH